MVGPFARGVAALTAAALLGCAATPPPRVAEPPPHLVLAQAAPAPAPSSSSTASPPRSTTNVDHASGASRRTAGWILVSIGGLAGLVALGTSYMMVHDRLVRGSECDAQKVCSSDGLDANRQIGDLAPWNAGAWVVAAAGLGVGAFLVLTSPKEPTTVGIAPNGSGGTLQLRSTF